MQRPENNQVNLNTLRQIIVANLSVATLTLVGLAVQDEEIPGAAPEPSPAPAPPVETTPPPMPPRAAPVNMRPAPNIKTRQGRRDPTSESIAVLSDGNVDAWTEASVPEPRREKVVNIADAMGHARMRTEPSRELTARPVR